ncbi:hypothetical protein [Marinococcus halophilus]|uniref:hypothetical protein n=1 Tax=Marinococcus halophilus TaxID=1371 RepID=UPI0009A5D2C2|nr:hypothetical protein [Marinococcus halophilus]
MQIQTMPGREKEHLFTCYYPQYAAEWAVTFQTLFGERKEKIITVGDGITNRQSIIDHLPVYTTTEVKRETVIPYEIERNAFQEQGKEILRKYFLYQRRSWKVPVVQWEQTYVIYAPYQIEDVRKGAGNKMKTMLYEVSSGSYDKLEKFPIIQQFYQERGE